MVVVRRVWLYVVYFYGWAVDDAKLCFFSDRKLTKFEKARTINLREGGLSYCLITVHVQHNSNKVKRIWKQRFNENRTTLKFGFRPLKMT
ncbi:hypothetical protein TNCV_4010781 [Trichonephila clavipes]|nr:hypothetical protein TNCV_4010781 [Trichonephila clavipes]